MYNREKRNALWAAEVILPPDGSKVDRSKSHFKEDAAINEKWRSKLQDYRGSGFDRGHLVPAADVHASQKHMNDTFYLTNISPQVAVGFNRGYWAALEKMLRNTTVKGQFDRVHVYTGPLWLPIKDPETGHFKVNYRVLGDSTPGTAVPTHFFKVALGVKGSKKYLAAFVLPNEPIDIHTPLRDFLVPLDAVERATGIEFFPLLRPDLTLLPLCNKVDCGLVHDFKKKLLAPVEKN